MDTYRVVRRFFEERGPRVIKRGLTLEEAQKHCANPETSSSTCKSARRKAYTRRWGWWFDTYEKEK